MANNLVDVLILTADHPETPPEIAELSEVLLRELSGIEGLTIKTEFVRAAFGADFNIYVGYNYEMLGHFFSKLHETDSFFIFFSPASEGPEDSINSLLRDCVDNMGCSSEVYKRVVGVWSYKEIVSYVKQRLVSKKKLTKSAAPKAAAAAL